MSKRGDRIQSAITRPSESSIMRWILLTGSRLTVLVAIMGLVYVALLALAVINPIGMRDLLTETDAVKMLFSSLLSGAILLVSVVVSINSVVLSQEMTDLENQQQRINASMEYHRQIESFIEADITPARPADFLNAVLYAISNQVVTLTKRTRDYDDESFQEDLNEYTEHVANDIEKARETLSQAKLGSFKVLLAGLNYNYSGQLHATRGFKRKYGDDLDDEALNAIDELVETLKYVGTGREYFKSLYYKRELAHLSSRLLYISLPVIVFTSYVILAVDADLFPEISTFGLSPLVLSVLLAYTLSLAPYILLTVYVIRAATIALRTLAAGPFILQEGSDIESLQWDPPSKSRDWELKDQNEDGQEAQVVSND